jgi:hypothetical protein
VIAVAAIRVLIPAVSSRAQLPAGRRHGMSLAAVAAKDTMLLRKARI